MASFLGNDRGFLMDFASFLSLKFISKLWRLNNEEKKREKEKKRESVSELIFYYYMD